MCVWVYTCICVHEYLCMCVCIYVDMCMCLCVYVCMCTCACMCVVHVYIYMYLCMCICVHVCSHASVHVGQARLTSGVLVGCFLLYSLRQELSIEPAITTSLASQLGAEIPCLHLPGG